MRDRCVGRGAILSIGLAIGLAGCSQVAEKAENAANRSYTSYALGKSYSEIANLGQSPMWRLSGSEATFGPMIGATPLKNGMTIYRHMAPAARTETGTNFAGLVGDSTVSENNRLSYFLVDADGMVKDSGSVQGSASDCVQYIGGIINRCNDTRQLQASLALYDIRVATKGGQPISSWGEPAAPVVN
ncbi:hypothetical protein HJB56_05255 [Rhizobium lentis]|uniref:hypothetical protein n=2 Tax=Rhizobium lentis TaxID=1138194 RepID=UPI001C832E88|nr:hypothetical protein [Rhizobium lentis]MBX5082192.1 hypothetical protein [Rhizobium lentis]MBX5094902.1 hypothetical protein [Rhizobium lentis]MBX5119627.1 hypothetical protein [Rhizobium lentis]MBX5126171.1 hypothetical protein [Rhizobium lentis]